MQNVNVMYTFSEEIPWRKHKSVNDSFLLKCPSYAGYYTLTTTNIRVLFLFICIEIKLSMKWCFECDCCLHWRIIFIESGDKETDTKASGGGKFGIMFKQCIKHICDETPDCSSGLMRNNMFILTPVQMRKHGLLVRSSSNF